MSFIKTIVVRPMLERATPIFRRKNATPRSRRGSPSRSRPASVVLLAGLLRVAGSSRKITADNLQARIVNQCEIRRR